MEDQKSKVFISYSWSTSEKVLELAHRLMDDGVDVLLDKWHLQEGQDKYAFMEQCVNNAEVSKVLLICDETYAKKADARTGGVGDETLIITPEIYENASQKKFLPVVFQFDSDGKACVPKYIKSRLYFDLSTEDDKYETEYEKLLRNIYEKPLYKKPPLGKRPQWLDEEDINTVSIRGYIRQIRNLSDISSAKSSYVTQKAIQAIIDILTGFSTDYMTEEKIVEKIEETHPIRDICVDFFDAIVYSGLPLVDTITLFFEKVYNESHAGINGNSYRDSVYEHFDFFIWETFIAMTAILLHYEKYAELHDVLAHTYFLRTSDTNIENLKEHDYSSFRPYFYTLEEGARKKTEPMPYTLSGKMLIEWEKSPLVNKKALVNADNILYQLSIALNLSVYWFPTTYVYLENGSTMWIKLKSVEYCKKVMPLFGAKTLEELKAIVSRCEPDSKMRYPEAIFKSAPNVLSSIELEKIGSIR